MPPPTRVVHHPTSPGAQEVQWPRELYVNIQGCKGLVPQTRRGIAGPTNPSRASTAPDGFAADANVTPGSTSGSQVNGSTTVNGSTMTNGSEPSGSNSDVPGELGGGGVEDSEEVAGAVATTEDSECFARIVNTTTGNDLQVRVKYCWLEKLTHYSSFFFQ